MGEQTGVWTDRIFLSYEERAIIIRHPEPDVLKMYGILLGEVPQPADISSASPNSSEFLKKT
jgi:hypothetical protein